MTSVSAGCDRSSLPSHLLPQQEDGGPRKYLQGQRLPLHTGYVCTAVASFVCALVLLGFFYLFIISRRLLHLQKGNGELSQQRKRDVCLQLFTPRYNTHTLNLSVSPFTDVSHCSVFKVKVLSVTESYYNSYEMEILQIIKLGESELLLERN